MTDTDGPFLIGEVVWVKLGNRWWPGEVYPREKVPDEVITPHRKQPVAIVKFFNEDTYEFVKNPSNICRYNCPNKLDLIRKGMALYRANNNKYMNKFPDDVKFAEELVGGDVDILDSIEFDPIKKVDYSSIFGDQTKKTPKKGTKSPNKNEITPSKRGRKKKIVTEHEEITTRRSSSYNIIKQHESRILPIVTVQTSPNLTPGAYKCHLCNFSSARQNVIVLHAKVHSNDKAAAVVYSNVKGVVHSNEKAVSARFPDKTPDSTTPKGILKKQPRPPTPGPSSSNRIQNKKPPRPPTPGPSSSRVRVETPSSLNDNVSNEPPTIIIDLSDDEDDIVQSQPKDIEKPVIPTKSNLRTDSPKLVAKTSKIQFNESEEESTRKQFPKTPRRTTRRYSPAETLSRKITSSSRTNLSLDENNSEDENTNEIIVLDDDTSSLNKSNEGTKSPISSTPHKNEKTEQEVMKILEDWIDDDEDDNRSAMNKTNGSTIEISNSENEISLSVSEAQTNKDEQEITTVSDKIQESIDTRKSLSEKDETIINHLSGSSSESEITLQQTNQTTATPKYRNIPKKDRRDIVLKDFNNLTENKEKSHTDMDQNSAISIEIDDNKTSQEVMHDGDISSVDKDDKMLETNVLENEVLLEDVNKLQEKEKTDLNENESNAKPLSNEDEQLQLEESTKDVSSTNNDEDENIGQISTKEDDITAKSNEPSQSTASLTPKSIYRKPRFSFEKQKETPTTNKSQMSCFDFNEENENNLGDDFLASISMLKKKYMSSATDDSKDDKLELDKKDKQLCDDIESVLNETQPFNFTEGYQKLASEKAATFLVTQQEVRTLPPKERGKRIFKSRNRSRFEESVPSTSSSSSSSSVTAMPASFNFQQTNVQSQLSQDLNAQNENTSVHVLNDVEKDVSQTINDFTTDETNKQKGIIIEEKITQSSAETEMNISSQEIENHVENMEKDVLNDSAEDDIPQQAELTKDIILDEKEKQANNEISIKNFSQNDKLVESTLNEILEAEKDVEKIISYEKRSINLAKMPEESNTPDVHHLSSEFLTESVENVEKSEITNISYNQKTMEEQFVSDEIQTITNNEIPEGVKISVEEKSEEEKILSEEKSEEEKTHIEENSEEESIPIEEKPEEESIPIEEKPEEESIPSEEKPEEEGIPIEEKPEEESIPSEKKPEEEGIPIEEKPEEESIPIEEKPGEENITTEEILKTQKKIEDKHFSEEEIHVKSTNVVEKSTEVVNSISTEQIVESENQKLNEDLTEKINSTVTEAVETLEGETPTVESKYNEEINQISTELVQNTNQMLPESDTNDNNYRNELDVAEMLISMPSKLSDEIMESRKSVERLHYIQGDNQNIEDKDAVVECNNEITPDLSAIETSPIAQDEKSVEDKPPENEKLVEKSLQEQHENVQTKPQTRKRRSHMKITPRKRMIQEPDSPFVIQQLEFQKDQLAVEKIDESSPSTDIQLAVEQKQEASTLSDLSNAAAAIAAREELSESTQKTLEKQNDKKSLTSKQTTDEQSMLPQQSTQGSQENFVEKYIKDAFMFAGGDTSILAEPKENYQKVDEQKQIVDKKRESKSIMKLTGKQITEILDLPSMGMRADTPKDETDEINEKIEESTITTPQQIPIESVKQKSPTKKREKRKSQSSSSSSSSRRKSRELINLLQTADTTTPRKSPSKSEAKRLHKTSSSVEELEDGPSPTTSPKEYQGLRSFRPRKAKENIDVRIRASLSPPPPLPVDKKSSSASIATSSSQYGGTSSNSELYFELVQAQKSTSLKQVIEKSKLITGNRRQSQSVVTNTDQETLINKKESNKPPEGVAAIKSSITKELMQIRRATTENKFDLSINTAETSSSKTSSSSTSEKTIKRRQSVYALYQQQQQLQEEQKKELPIENIQNDSETETESISPAKQEKLSPQKQNIDTTTFAEAESNYLSNQNNPNLFESKNEAIQKVPKKRKQTYDDIDIEDIPSFVIQKRTARTMSVSDIEHARQQQYSIGGIPKKIDKRKKSTIETQNVQQQLHHHQQKQQNVAVMDINNMSICYEPSFSSGVANQSQQQQQQQLHYIMTPQSNSAASTLTMMISESPSSSTKKFMTTPSNVESSTTISPPTTSTKISAPIGKKRASRYKSTSSQMITEERKQVGVDAKGNRFFIIRSEDGSKMLVRSEDESIEITEKTNNTPEQPQPTLSPSSTTPALQIFQHQQQSPTSQQQQLQALQQSQSITLTPSAKSPAIPDKINIINSQSINPPAKLKFSKAVTSGERSNIVGNRETTSTSTLSAAVQNNTQIYTPKAPHPPVCPTSPTTSLSRRLSRQGITLQPISSDRLAAKQQQQQYAIEEPPKIIIQQKTIIDEIPHTQQTLHHSHQQQQQLQIANELSPSEAAELTNRYGFIEIQQDASTEPEVAPAMTARALANQPTVRQHQQTIAQYKSSVARKMKTKVSATPTLDSVQQMNVYQQQQLQQAPRPGRKKRNSTPIQHQQQQQQQHGIDAVQFSSQLQQPSSPSGLQIMTGDSSTERIIQVSGDKSASSEKKNLFAIEGENFGRPPGSFILCALEEDGSYKPINDTPLYLKGNDLVPSTADAVTNDDSQIIVQPDASVVYEASNDASPPMMNDLCQNQVNGNQFLINGENAQLLVDQQGLIAIAATIEEGGSNGLITIDGQTIMLGAEAISVILQHANLINRQMLLGESETEITATANSDILAAALAGSAGAYQGDHQIMQIDESGNLIQIEANDNGSGIQIVEQDLVSFQPIAPRVTNTSETNATHPPIMSTLEVPSSKKKSKLDPSGTLKTNESGLIGQNLEDSLAVIGVTQSLSSVPSSLNLPITVTNPEIAPKSTGNPIGLGGIFPNVTAGSQMSPTLSSIVSSSNNQDQEYGVVHTYDVFAAAAAAASQAAGGGSLTVRDDVGANEIILQVPAGVMEEQEQSQSNEDGEEIVMADFNVAGIVSNEFVVQDAGAR